MARNTSVSLGNHFDDFVESKITQGRYKNVSEVIRAGLRLLEDEENRALALKEAIAAGIKSGPAHGFNPKQHLRNLKGKKSANA